MANIEYLPGDENQPQFLVIPGNGSQNIRLRKGLSTLPDHLAQQIIDTTNPIVRQLITTNKIRVSNVGSDVAPPLTTHTKTQIAPLFPEDDQLQSLSTSATVYNAELKINPDDNSYAELIDAPIHNKTPENESKTDIQTPDAPLKQTIPIHASGTTKSSSTKSSSSGGYSRRKRNE